MQIQNTNILLAQTQNYNNWQRPKVKLQFMFMNRIQMSFYDSKYIETETCEA